jgi:inorganic pyrophosphatase
MHDEAGDDPKLLMIPHDDPSWSHNEHLSDINPALLEEIAHFFSVYKDLEEHKQVTIGDWEDREAAEALIKAGRDRFTRAQPS